MNDSLTLHTREILVVDDNADLRGIMEVVLESEGYAVAGAANGAEALKLLRGSAPLPRVILLDLMMPVMDGYAFYDESQRDPRLSSIPVVVVTADGHADAKAAALGAAGALQKPVDLDALLAEVRKYAGET